MTTCYDQALVFGSESALGNPTGVVWLEDDATLETSELQRVTASLGLEHHREERAGRGYRAKLALDWLASPGLGRGHESERRDVDAYQR